MKHPLPTSFSVMQQVCRQSCKRSTSHPLYVAESGSLDLPGFVLPGYGPGGNFRIFVCLFSTSIFVCHTIKYEVHGYLISGTIMKCLSMLVCRIRVRQMLRQAGAEPGLAALSSHTATATEHLSALLPQCHRNSHW